MSLRDTARIGRNLHWTRRGIDEFGGGFLGLILLKMTEWWENRQSRGNGKKNNIVNKQEKSK